MNMYFKAPDQYFKAADQPEADADVEASFWGRSIGRSIGEEAREVAWLSFIVATLSTAGVGLGVVLALALDGYLI